MAKAHGEGGAATNLCPNVRNDLHPRSRRDLDLKVEGCLPCAVDRTERWPTFAPNNGPSTTENAYNTSRGAAARP